jgi:hypothetical protein
MSANETRGEISLTLDGAEHVLRPSYAAIQSFEKQTGKGLLALTQACGDGTITTAEAAAIVTECIKAWGKANDDELAVGVNVKRVGELIMESGLLIIAKQLELLLFLAATGGYAASGEARAAANTPETTAAA